MTSRPPANKGGRNGAKASGGAKGPAASKNKSESGKPKPKGSSKSSMPAAKKKKTARPKAGGRWSGFKPYLLGLSFGFLLGCLGVVAFLYLPQAIHAPSKERPAAASAPTRAATKASPTQRTAPVRSAPSPVSKPAPQASSPPSDQPLPYEENHRFGRQVKEIDRGLSQAFREVCIPEEDVHFLRVTPRTEADREWDHALIQVVLPSAVTAGALKAELEKALLQTGLSPTPRLADAVESQGPVFQVYFNGANTHTLQLAARETAEPAATTDASACSTGRPKVAIIIDDFGETMQPARQFLELEVPVAFSVMPFLLHSDDIARMAHERGRVVMVHLPMQPAGWPEIRMGPGALLLNMDRFEIEDRVRSALESVPYAVGANNHMGSRFTEDAERMNWVLEIVRSKGLFFVDSRTGTRSKAYAEAKRMGIPASRRSIFLDNIQDPEAIRIQLHKLVARARQSGQAVGIGHPYSVTCQVLKNEYNYLNSKVDLVQITSLLR